MTRHFLLTRVRAAAFALVIRGVAASATCYYPDGSEAASSESPCSSADGAACCPNGWQCLDNGLCHYEANNLYGSYSCTDQSWKAAGCPSNLCTYNLTRVGGESISQCSSHNNDWCCDADAVHVNCCAESPTPRPFFELASGSAYATAGSSTASSAPTLSSITGLASGSASASGEAASSTPAASGSSSPTQSSGAGSSKGSSAAPVTSQFTSITSGTAGVQTLVITSIIQPSGASTSGAAASSTSPSHNHIGLIVGCAVGVPLALALAGILIWLCHKRRQQKANPYDAPPDVYGNGDNTSTLNDSPEFAGGAKLHKKEKSGLPIYKNEMPGVSELPGQSVGPGRPISTIPGRAELQSGAAFAPGTTPHAPHLVGVGGGTGNTPPTSSQGGSSWGSAPPGYSPGVNQQAWQGPHDGAVEADGTAVPGHSGAATNITEGGRYIPYRPPPGHAAATGHHLQEVPEAAEMSAVRTPPAE